jgi:site-specific DNA-methyltransferase (adenine-specific)
MLDEQSGELKSANTGGASRFFYCAKVSTKERELGCEDLPVRTIRETVEREPGSVGAQSPRAGAQKTAGAPIFACQTCGLNLNSGARAGSLCWDGGPHVPIEVAKGPEVRNHHVTLKPITLTTWLARLIKPPTGATTEGSCLLVPFCGAGSEMIGGVLAGFDEVVGIERDEDYVAIANARLARWSREKT